MNIHEAKTHLSRLLLRVVAGEEVVIAKAGKPIARLVPAHKPRGARVLGTERGRITVASDFDALLPPDLRAAFDGEDTA